MPGVPAIVIVQIVSFFTNGNAIYFDMTGCRSAIDAYIPVDCISTFIYYIVSVRPPFFQKKQWYAKFWRKLLFFFEEKLVLFCM
jgi:hypothetical protein